MTSVSSLAVRIGLCALLVHTISSFSSGEAPATPANDHSTTESAAQIKWNTHVLTTQLRRVMPTANVVPIPFSSTGSSTGFILTGTVARAEDVDVILNAARSLGGLQIVNCLKVGGGQQVQLDVVIVGLKPGLAQSIVLPFVKRAGKITTSAQAGEMPFMGPLHLKRDATDLLSLIRALKREGLAQELARPTLATLSGDPASFMVGSQQAFAQQGLGTVSITYQEFGTKLIFLPVVLGNGKIHLEIEPEVSWLTPGNGRAIDGVAVREPMTTMSRATVELRAGQTFVFGGMVQHTERPSTTKLPVLGDLPLFGPVFRSTRPVETEEELLILVTPTLVHRSSGNEARSKAPSK